MRHDVVKMYREIHSWVGIVCGLFLFIAFYAGAVSMFETPLQRWASAPVSETSITPLQQTPLLVKKVLAEYPAAAKGYQIILQPGPEQPARLSWQVRAPGGDDHAPVITHYANLNAKAELVVSEGGPSPVAEQIDVLHQQVGLPFEHDISMPFMGVVALLYGIALVSGVFVLFPTLVKDLFALRIGKNLKRMWLDLHNLLGLFSLPFHIIMALTAVVFAFHDQFYGAQRVLLYPSSIMSESRPAPADMAAEAENFIAPAALVERLAVQAPDFKLTSLNYRVGRDGALELRAMGENPRYGTSFPRAGAALVDPVSGDIVGMDYLPGQQGKWQATVSSFFALHFGNYGGNFIRWCYFFLGLTGAFLFYTGNLLWLESKRKKRRKKDGLASIEQSRSARMLGALTVGVPLGCVAGISVMIAVSKLAPDVVMSSLTGGYQTLYYSVFVVAIGWAFRRGAAQAAVDLLRLAAVCTLLIPFASLLSLLPAGLGWNHFDSSSWVDVIAAAGAVVLFIFAGKTSARIRRAPEDSLWYQPSKGRVSSAPELTAS